MIDVIIRRVYTSEILFFTADDQVENDDTSSSSSSSGIGITSAIGIGTNYHHLHKNGDLHHQVSACVCWLLSQGQIYLSFLLSIRKLVGMWFVVTV